MTDDALWRLGVGVLLGEASVALLLIVAVLLVAFLGGRHRARRARALDDARRTLATLLTADEVGRTPPAAPALALAALRAHRRAVLEALVLEFGRTVRGASVAELAAIAHALGLVAPAERRCRSRWWWRRLQGARLLGAIDHDCPALRTLRHDRHPTVRAEVLHWAAGRADREVIVALVERLDDPARLCRFTVRDSLLRLGAPASAALGRYLERAGEQGLLDALLVARGLAQPTLLEPALRLCRHGDPVVRARATAVLGALGGDVAAEALVHQLADANAAVREAAARAIGEIGHWSAASALARCLGDPSFPVRRESALALRRLGSVGVLILRRAREDDNPFVVDMATQVLDLPDSVFHRMAA
jgi:hypothetical protein